VHLRANLQLVMPGGVFAVWTAGVAQPSIFGHDASRDLNAWTLDLEMLKTLNPSSVALAIERSEIPVRPCSPRATGPGLQLITVVHRYSVTAVLPLQLWR